MVFDVEIPDWVVEFSISRIYDNKITIRCCKEVRKHSFSIPEKAEVERCFYLDYVISIKHEIELAIKQLEEYNPYGD